jgi:enhancing lycopene biosynthesis protein 2
MSELSSQAYDREIKNAKLEMKNVKNEGAEARVYRFPAWARAQIISPETGEEVNDGETGLVRIFDLGNVRSVLAIQTDDLAIRRGEGFELLGRARLSEPRGCSLMTP